MNFTNTNRISIDELRFLNSCLRLPFDYHNPVSYLFAFAMQVTPCYASALMYGFIISFSIGSSIVMMAFAHDVKAHFIELNSLKGNKEHRKLILQFLDGINFHRIAKQLSLQNKFK